MTITHEQRFPVRTPKFETVEQEPVEQCDLSTATLWMLHLRFPAAPLRYDTRLKTILALGFECITEEFIGGDSFFAWAEPAAGEEFDRALHLEFVAPTLEAALRAARAMCERMAEAGYVEYLSPKNVTLSTAGDWAEQAEVWA